MRDASENYIEALNNDQDDSTDPYWLCPECSWSDSNEPSNGCCPRCGSYEIYEDD